MQKGWLNLAQLHNLNISVFSIPAMTSYTFESDNALKYKTLITQEMLKKGFLASTIFYSCTAHNEEHINKYLDELDIIYKTINMCESGKLNIDNLLEGPICHSGFKRLN